MALETCLAFLLADELDADDNAPLVADAFQKLQRNRDEDTRKYYFSTVVPRYSVSDFQSHFQLTPTQAEELMTVLAPCSWGVRWRVREAVLASLWTLATLDSYRDVAERFGTSKSVICHHLHQFCSLVTQHLHHRIRWPAGSDADAVVAGFSSVAGLPGTLGAVGSWHVPIEAPADVPDPEAFRNGRGFYSVNLLAVCDHVGRFTHVSAEHPGGWPNSRVLQATRVGRALQEDPLALLGGRHLVGDATYPLSEHLLTPFPDLGGTLAGTKRARYNARVESALKVARRPLRLLRVRFQRLRSLQIHSVAKSSAAVTACCILHNIALEEDSHSALLEEDTADGDDPPVTQEAFHTLPNGHSGSLGGRSKRQDIAASLGRRTRN